MISVWEWQWHQPDHMQTIYTSVSTDNRASTSSPDFHQPGALLNVKTDSVKALKAKCTDISACIYCCWLEPALFIHRCYISVKHRLVLDYFGQGTL